ncbi:sigma 54-interacting transcriptional regulator [Rhodovastum atsumiense]|uniref:sigma 54-interacting transcriptional regulator n=1 Tax=Rhodovastum atsumiense TaxID=504468 RepID=UPI00202590E2|nr:sigma 54-interacting transcriptional regulator [Rhodovastum atsumiense]
MTGTDVEIVDEFMVRVAGSGIYRHMLNENMADNGYIYRQTLHTKQTILVENPGENAVCSHCAKRHSCRELLDLSTPIVLDGHVLGVIGIICSTVEQRGVLLENIDRFIIFIEQIADLIAEKAFATIERRRDRQMAEVLCRLIEVIDRGVVVVSSDGIIQQGNMTAARMFGHERDLAGFRIDIDPTGDVLYDCEEARMTLEGGSRLHALCRRIVLPHSDRRDVTVITFREARDFLPQPIAAALETRSPARLLGHSPAMRDLRSAIERVARSSVCVLITGESGTGKENVAHAIHHTSARRNSPFVTINCAAIPDQLLESELFGYVRGAFSGADPKGRIGKFELAHGGSILLDEIGDMPLYLQSKLLRVLQEHTITRVGSNQVIDIDVRIIAATNTDIEELVRRGLFRLDLFYRLNVVPIVIPPLRDRREDIAELAQHFADEIAGQAGRPREKIPDDVSNALYFHDWPGNVRELRNAVEYIDVMRGEAGSMNVSHLPPALRRRPPSPAFPVSATEDTKVETRVKVQVGEAERIGAVLARHGWSLEGKRRAAAELGIGIATLYRRIRSLGLSERHPSPPGFVASPGGTKKGRAIGRELDSEGRASVVR